MKKFIPLFLLIAACFPTSKGFAQRISFPDSLAMRKEWLQTISRTTEDLGLTYNHSSMGAILVERADAEANLKRYSKAIDDYNKAIFFNPGLKTIYVRRARVYEVMGNFKAAISDYEKALANFKGDKFNEATTWNAIAGNQLELNNYAKAVKADSAAIAAYPQFAMAYANKGWANMHLGKFQQAVDDFTEALKGFQNSPQELAAVYRNRADAYRNLEKFSEAISDYNSALQYVPDLVTAYWGLAMCYGLTHQFLLAENNFARTAKLLNGDNQQLSKLYIDWGGLEDIRRDYAKKVVNDSLAWAYDNKNTTACGALAHAYALNGQMQQSVDKFNYLVKFYQGNKAALTEIYASVAEQEYFLGHYDKAIEASSAALTVDPQALLLYIIRGRSYIKKSNNDLATADFNKIMTIDTAKQSDTYALALFFTGKQEQALGIIQAHFTAATDNMVRLNRCYQLARICSLMNKPDEANSYLKRSIDGGYSTKYALVDPDLASIRNTKEFKDIIAGEK